MKNTSGRSKSPRRITPQSFDQSEVGVIAGWACPDNMPEAEAGPMAWSQSRTTDGRSGLADIIGSGGLMLASKPVARSFMNRRMSAVFLIADMSMEAHVIPTAAAKFASSYGTYTEAMRCVEKVRAIWLPSTLSPEKVATIAANELILFREESPHEIPDDEVVFLVWRVYASSFGGGTMTDLADTIKESVFPYGEIDLRAPFDTTEDD